MNEPAIKFEQVSFSYKETSVLKNISFQIRENEFVGIIGPNGGGKTTLLKLIIDSLKPNHGHIEIFGKSVHSSLKLMAYVPQTATFDKQFPISVMELVLSGRLSKLHWWGRYSKLDKEKALEALSEVGLLDFQDKSFGTLSGGQAQRALIARALVSEPKLLLLDEPTASVDSQAEADIYQLLAVLKGKMTLVMVTHDLNTVLSQVDRVILVQGNVISLKPEEVCEHFAVGLYHSPLIKISTDGTS